MTVVGDGNRQRIYLPPSAEHIAAAAVKRPDDVPAGELPGNPRDFKTPNYGMTTWADLFTNRQLVALATFSDSVPKARDRVLADGGTPEYADAVATYLGFSVSKALARNNTMCGWESGMDRLRGSFQRQAVPMTWDFAEANPLTSAGGGLAAVVQSEVEVLEALLGREAGYVMQADAASRTYGPVISTDPPYYDRLL
jgi:putative DNA methylase